jgi:hypothetical protein
MKDWQIDTGKDPVNFTLAALESEVWDLDTLNFSECFTGNKVEEVCDALARRGIAEITVSSNDSSKIGEMIAQFCILGWELDGMRKIYINNKEEYAFVLKRG